MDETNHKTDPEYEGSSSTARPEVQGEPSAEVPKIYTRLYNQGRTTLLNPLCREENLNHLEAVMQPLHATFMAKIHNIFP